MNKRSRAAAVVAGMMASAGAAAGGAAAPSLCTRLADEARRAPAATWVQPDPLSAWIRRAAPSPGSPTAAALAGDPRWREALGGSREPGVQQLEGAHLYMLSDVQGTASCQSVVLVDAQPGRAPRQVQPPFDLEGPGLCMTRSAGFARVLGQPAFIAGGAPSMTSPDFEYRIATWSGAGWNEGCRVTLMRHAAMRPGQRFCPPDSKVCSEGQGVAQRLALAYEASRAARQPLDEVAFNRGRRPDSAVAAALNPPLDEPGAVGDMNPPFPLFGADEKRLNPMATVFSNADPRRVPVLVGGRWWIAVVGRSGVGWREGEAVLVALFAPPGRRGDGVASYQFRVEPTALREVVAEDLGPEK